MTNITNYCIFNFFSLIVNICTWNHNETKAYMDEIEVRIVHFSIVNGTCQSAITPKTSEFSMNLINHFDNPSELHHY